MRGREPNEVSNIFDDFDFDIVVVDFLHNNYYLDNLESIHYSIDLFAHYHNHNHAVELGILLLNVETLATFSEPKKREETNVDFDRIEHSNHIELVDYNHHYHHKAYQTQPISPHIPSTKREYKKLTIPS